MLELTGPQLFLRYAWPCSEYKLRTGKISEKDFHLLEKLVRTGDHPDISLLASCFADAEKALRNTSKHENIWSLESVTEYWRHNHGHNGDCAVRAVIISLVGNKTIANVLGSKFPVLNLYSIPLKIADLVFIHRMVIIEKGEK